MYIKQVVIDGFKSYATRTTISGFDPQFNAITGLNGSGKSNILDSICFLLGISNLTQVNVNFLPYTLVVEEYKNYGNLFLSDSIVEQNCLDLDTFSVVRRTQNDSGYTAVQITILSWF